ncbi:MAG: NfeD family protein [Ferroplasma sp.]
MKRYKIVKIFILIFIILILISSLLPVSKNSNNTVSVQSKSVLIINLTGDINAGSSTLFHTELSAINSSYIAAVVINMDSKGGELENMLTIVNYINAAEALGIPVYTYIGSGSNGLYTGAYIAMASDKIYMCNSSEIGSAKPYVIGTAAEKQDVENDMSSLMYSMALSHSKNTSAAVSMVINDSSYNGKNAMAAGLINGNSNSINSMLKELNLSNYNRVYVGESLFDQFLSSLSNPVIAGILILIGIVAIFLDFYHGTVILSVAGIIMIGLGLLGAELIDASFFGIILLLVAGVLIFLEFKTNHGIALLSGLIIGMVGIYFLASAYGTANPGYSPSPFGMSFYITGIIILILGMLLIIYLKKIIKSQSNSHYTGAEALIGHTGIAMDNINKNENGFISIDGIEWEATAMDNIKKYDNVMITGRDGLKLIVKKI